MRETMEFKDLIIFWIEDKAEFEEEVKEEEETRKVFPFSNLLNEDLDSRLLCTRLKEILPLLSNRPKAI